jgi:hypothetical protein
VGDVAHAIEFGERAMATARAQQDPSVELAMLCTMATHCPASGQTDRAARVAVRAS